MGSICELCLGFIQVAKLNHAAQKIIRAIETTKTRRLSRPLDGKGEPPDDPDAPLVYSVDLAVERLFPRQGGVDRGGTCSHFSCQIFDVDSQACPAISKWKR